MSLVTLARDRLLNVLLHKSLQYRGFSRTNTNLFLNAVRSASVWQELCGNHNTTILLVTAEP